MTLQFNPVALFLVALIFLGVIGNNNSITISATVLLLMQQTFLSKYIPQLEKSGLTIGIIILNDCNRLTYWYHFRRGIFRWCARWPIDCRRYLLAIFRPRKIISFHL